MWGAAEHRGPAPHPAPQGLGAARRQRGKISPVLCYVQDVLCVCLGSDPRLRQQMRLWCWLETLTASVCAVQCSPGAAAEVQILPAGCSCWALEGCPWPASCSMQLSEHFLQVFSGFSACEHPRWSGAASSLCCLLCEQLSWSMELPAAVLGSPWGGEQ